jgi:hypothetical protein
MGVSAAPAAAALGAQPPPPATALGAMTYGPGMVRQNVAAIEAAQKDKEAKQAPIYERMQADIDKDRAREQKIDADYTPVEVTKPPPPPQNDPLQGFASAAGIFAMLASALTHTPAINAMNGMASAINATKANDWKAYEEGYKQWKANTDLAIEKHKLQAADMSQALEKMQTDLSTGVAMAKAVAAASDDKIATKFLEEGEYEKLGQYQIASASAARQMQESALRIQEMMPKAIASQRMTAALKSGDPAQIAAATTMMAEVNDPASFAAQTQEKQARTIAADPTSYKDGKLTDEAFQKIMAIDPKLAMDVRKSGFEKAYAPANYRLKDGSNVTVIVSPDGTAREVGTNRLVNLEGAVKAGPETPAAAKDKDIRTIAEAEVTKQEAIRQSTGQPPLTDAEKAQIRLNTAATSGGSPLTPEQREANAAQVATGEPLIQVIPGFGQAGIKERSEARFDAIGLIQKETGMSAADAGRELARRGSLYAAQRSSALQIDKMLGATEQAVPQLDFNIQKTKEEMAKLPSTNLSPILNAIARGEERWTGDPAYSSLFYYMHATALESARILAGGQASIAQLHQGAMDEAAKWASENMTPASFDAVSKAMHDEGQNRIQTYTDALKIQSAMPGEARPTVTPPAVPLAGPKEGDTNISKSGKSIIFRNGQWEYQ